MLAYRNRPEGEPEPIKTNWTTVSANDNASPEDVVDLRYDRRLECVPSIKAIADEMHKEPVVVRGHTVAIGKLRFSDGTQTEKAYTRGPEGAVIQYDAILPAGAMLGTKENADAKAGGSENQNSVRVSNAYFADVLGTTRHRYKSGKRDKKRGKSYSAAESQAMLDAAIANTENMPPVKVYPPGLPCGSSSVRDSFVGMRKGKTGSGGAIAWEDIASSMVHREIWEDTLMALKADDKRTLDSALTAGTLSDISPGGTKRGSRKRGKRYLLAANDNLAEAIRKYSA